MSAEVDVAIVGGGPSGAAAAHYLASRGHSVLVCEKKSFPREKTCGDGLTPRAVKVLDEMGLGEQLRTWERVQGLRVHAAGRTLELAFPELEDFADFGLVKPRRELDQIVLDNAEAAGAKVLYETQVHEPVFDRGILVGFRAKRAGNGLGHRAGSDAQWEEVRAKFVVCAEGAATKFGRSLGRERNLEYPMGLAIRQYFRSPMQSSGWFEAYLDVRSGPRGGLGRTAGREGGLGRTAGREGGLGRTAGREDNLPGYGWVFPVGDGTVNAGVGLLSTFGGWRDINLHDLQRNFVDNLPPEWEVNYETVCSKPRAGRLFMGGSVWPPHGPGFVLTGDAAGMINPCNGEGIAYAYETGRIAGRHLDEALRNGGNPVLSGYTQELRETYGPYFRLGRRFVKLIGHPVLMEKLVSLGMRSKTVMSFALTLMANLEDSRAHNAEQKGLKAMLKLAEWKP